MASLRQRVERAKKEVSKTLEKSRQSGRTFGGRVRIPSRREVSDGMTARAEIIAKQKEQAEKLKQEQLKKLQEEQQAQKEKQRIQNIKREIKRRGAQQRTQLLKNQKGETIKQIVTNIKKIEKGKPTDVTVFESYNLNTGEYKAKAFEKRKTGARKVMTGGVNEKRYTPAEVKTMAKKLPVGDQYIYDPNTMQIKAIRSFKLRETIPFTEKGIKYYNSKLQKMYNTTIINKPKQINLKNLKSAKDYYNTAKEITKLLASSQKQVPKELLNYATSLFIKGPIKVGLYAVDNAGAVTQLRYDIKKKKLVGPTRSNLKLITDRMGTVKKWVGYDYKTNPLADPDYQAVAFATALSLLGVSGGIAKSLGASPKVVSIVSKGSGLTEKGLWAGIIGTSAYSTAKNPTPENIAKTESLLILPKVYREVVGRGMKSVRVKKGYNTALKDLEKTYGKNSNQVREFKAMWNRAFKGEISRNFNVKKSWTSKDVKVIYKNPKAQKITNQVMAKYKPEIIGSTVIKPQTRLKRLPRGKAGDVDIQRVPGLINNNAKRLANELALKLKRAGFNSKVKTGKDKLNPGKLVYRVVINGKEFVNIHQSSKYFTKTQAGPILNWYEFEKIGAWNLDPRGVRLGNIRDQLRIKLWKGFVEKSRAKDIKDARGIFKGTNKYLKRKKSKISKKSISKNPFTEQKLKKLYKDSKVRAEYSLSRDYSYSNLGRKLAYYSKLKSPVSKSIYSKGFKDGYKTKYGSKVPKTKYKKKKFQEIYNKGYSAGYKSPKITKPKKTPTPKYSKGKYSKSPYTPTPKEKKKYTLLRNKTPITTNKKKPLITIKKFKKQTLPKKQPTYYVVMKRKGKLVKLAPKPFVLKDAKDFLAYRIDKGLSRQAFFVPSGKAKKVFSLPKPVQGYFSKNKNKLRPYKIRQGKKKRLLQGYIEKTKYAIDSPGEKRGLKKARRKRKITSIQKKVLLKRLEKARRIKKSKKPNRIVAKRKVANLVTERRKIIMAKRQKIKKKPNRIVAKRKITPAQRKVLLKRLEKARRIKKLKVRSR